MTEDQAQLLGEIKAKTELTLGAVQTIQADVGHIKTRLTTLEVRAGTLGGVAGAVLGLGVSLLGEKLKQTLGT
jgi:hypothetical protein